MRNTLDAQGDRLRQELESVRAALQKADDPDRADLVSSALARDETALRDFLVSDSLWGGAGSIADEGGLSAGRTDARRLVEFALIQLGHAQVAEGLINVRTEGWIEVFRRWQGDGI